MNFEELKKIAQNCPNCGKEFKNLFAMSAHKGHCLGLNNYHNRSQEAKDKMSWNRDKILFEKEEIFCENSRFETGYAKKALLKFKIKKYECEICKIVEWQGKELVLELDHINGNNRDHRIENIRFLCPNCHSQTPNWRGRNKNTGKHIATDEELIQALKEYDNIRQALLSLGLAAKGGNYNRCKKLLKLMQEKPVQ